MVVSRKSYKFETLRAFILGGLAAIFLVAYPSMLSAVVIGLCSNCHTMHNSQNGAAMDSGGPNSYLLMNISGVSTDICVGCHSSTVANETVKNLGGSSVPIVFNTVQPSSPVADNMLAGGNFYWVSQDSASWDQYGHNVYGIVGADRNLSEAPGALDGCGVSECHTTLASSSNSRGKPGCQGCHFRVMHHVSDNATSSNTGYRFLWGHTFSSGVYTAYVEGVEDSNWEDTKSSSDHNFYKGTTVATPAAGANRLASTHTISAFCSGCHGLFHNDVGGPSSPWKRHPTDIALLETGEYNSYNPVTSYSPEVPVAWTDPTMPVRSEAIVMCLSCHRPHGSDQPDMLRWDYTTMIAGGGGSGGCFTCHTTKN